MISIVVPTLNEEGNIRRLIPSIIDVFSGKGIEVVILDGRSTDGTQELVKSFSRKHHYVRLVAQKGRGFANALAEGISAARGEIIVTMDAENHMPSEISKLVDELIGGDFDVVVGSRFMKGADVELERKRLLSSNIANRIARVGLRLNVKDCSSGFRAYKAEPVKEAVKKLRTKYFSVQVEILEKIKNKGGRLGEIPVHYMKRESGKSKFRLKAAMSDATNLIKIAEENELENIKRRSRKMAESLKSRPGRIMKSIRRMGQNSRRRSILPKSIRKRINSLKSKITRRQ
jgi:dolichol-phosphate mannosyltransferase